MTPLARAFLRTFRDVVVIALGVYAVLCAVLYFMQSGLLFQPDPDVEATPEQLKLPFEDLTLTASDGVRIHAWFIPAEKALGAVLFCHGNAGNISHRLDTLWTLHQMGADVLIFDYRGYGRSGGKPTEKGTYLDAEAAWRSLTEDRGFPPGRIVIHGRSLGGAVAAHLARDHTPAGLVLESTFSSVPDMGAKLYPMFPVRLLSKFRYATAEYAAAAKCPVLVVHSPDDDLVPYAQGRRVFEAASEPKRFLEIRGSHNSGYLESSQVYDPALRSFLEECFGVAGATRTGPPASAPSRGSR